MIGTPMLRFANKSHRLEHSILCSRIGYHQLKEEDIGQSVPELASPHFRVLVIKLNLIIWLSGLLCLMKLNSIIDIAQDGTNTVLVLYV